MSMDRVRAAIDAEWDASIIPCLQEYIKVPCQSPNYDEAWATNGLMDAAFDVLLQWMLKQPVNGLSYTMHKTGERTPFLFVEIPGTTATAHTVLMYGHMDKQPPMTGWSEGLGPYTPVIRDGKLYGRAGADDGYALCAAITAIRKLQQENIAHARTVIVIEGCEESGSGDLPFYIEQYKQRIGDVDLIICLDSGAMNYDQLWLTSSLRGVTGGKFKVQTLNDGMHSGIAGGVVPDPFRIARHLLSRIEDPQTGRFLVEEAWITPPKSVIDGMLPLNDIDFIGQYSLSSGVKVDRKDNVELAQRNYWEPCLTVCGCNYPPPAKAGNVIQPFVELKLSIRVPPFVDPNQVTAIVKRQLEKDPPHGALVTFTPEASGPPWSAPELSPWLTTTLRNASTAVFGKTFGVTGLGGSIPFMGMLGRLYPKAKFVVTGVLGPQSNAHGPNEFLHIAFAKGVTKCVAQVIADHFYNTGK